MATVADSGQDRKVSGGRVFERAFAAIRHNPGPTIGLAFLFGALPGLLVSILMEQLRPQMMAASLEQGSMMALYAITLLSALLGLVISALTQAALTRATVAEGEGRRAGFGESLRAGMAVLLPLIVLSILLAIAVMVGFVFLIVPGVILYCMWSVAVPALVEERRGIFGSFGRSRDLTRGARWKVFGILLVLAVVYWLISAAVGIFAMTNVDFSNPEAGLDLPLSFYVANVLVGTLINLLWATVQASLYVELRNWKDGPGTENLEQIFA